MGYRFTIIGKKAGRKTATLLLFIFTIIRATAFGQVDFSDSVAAANDIHLPAYINRTAEPFIRRHDSAGATRYLEQWLTDAGRKNDLHSRIAAYAFIGRFYKETGSIRAALSAYDTAMRLARDQRSLASFSTVLLHETGWLYYQNDQNAQGLENLIKANMYMQQAGYQQFPEIAAYLYELGYAYAYYYEDFASAELYVKQALGYPEKEPKLTMLCHNMLGLLYRTSQQLPASEQEFRTALHQAVQQKDTANIGEITGNIGYNYFVQNKLDSALPLIYIDYQYSYQKGNWSSACLAKMLLAKIAFLQNRFDSAAVYAKSAGELIEQKKPLLTKKAYYTICSSYYQVLVEIYKQQGKDQATIAAQDSLLYFTNQIFHTKDGKEQAAVQLKLIEANNQYQLNLLKSEENRKVLLRNTLIALCLLVATIAILVARQQKQKARATEFKLSDYANRLVENNQLLEQFRSEMEQLKNQPEKTETELKEVFKKLRTRTLLTEEDRQLFKTDFERIYKNFFSNIKEQIPDITPAEMRLIALTKLNLSTREMAELQGISPDSITKARYRLKKKIEIKARESSDLDSILKNVDA